MSSTKPSHRRMGLRVLLIATMVFVVGPFAGCKKKLSDAVRQDIAAQMQQRKPQISSCYKAALERNQQLRGTMTLTFVVAAKTGQVSAVKVVKNDLGDGELQKCVVAQTQGLKAKPATRPVEVTYPIDFAPM